LGGLTYNKQLERTVIRRCVRAACASFHYAHAARWTRGHAAAQLRRYAMRYGAVLPQVLLASFVCMPLLSHAQTCEWERPSEPSAGTDVIEVLRYGGFGAPAGRTVVSVDASGRATLLARGRCPDRTLVGRLASPSFDELANEFRHAVDSVRNQPPRPVVSDDHSLTEIIREGRMAPLCQSPIDGVDVDVTLYRDGRRERYTCVTGALLRFAESVLDRIYDAICTNRITTVCIERLVGQ
jgi:hypothetical protein